MQLNVYFNEINKNSQSKYYDLLHKYILWDCGGFVYKAHSWKHFKSIVCQWNDQSIAAVNTVRYLQTANMKTFEWNGNRKVKLRP